MEGEFQNYAFNVIDRDYLIKAAEFLIIKRETATIPRLFALLSSRMMRKLFSAVFYALVATVQKDSATCDKLITFFYEKYIMFCLRLAQPKE
jgi:hypothetical protein